MKLKKSLFHVLTTIGAVYVGIAFAQSGGSTSAIGGSTDISTAGTTGTGNGLIGGALESEQVDEPRPETEEEATPTYSRKIHRPRRGSDEVEKRIPPPTENGRAE